MKTRLKICGITRLEDARYCAAKGADFLGFIQHEASPRYVGPERAAEIIDWVYGPASVGVFVNATAEHVNRTAEEAGFDLVQLHGEEPAFEVDAIERPVIKSLRVQPDFDASTLRRWFREYEDVADYFLLDTFSTERYGGTGKTFDWRIAREIAREHRTFLAGGLDASNQAEAIEEVRPFGIDVSSALESSPGVKDFGKIDAFFEAFEAANASSSLDG